MLKDYLRCTAVCFTGHRKMQNVDIQNQLDDIVELLYKRNYRFFLTGGALGFDTESDLSVLRIQKKHTTIKLILVLPYPKQAEKWSIEEQEQYELIKFRATKIIYTGDRYTRGCYHARNRALVDGSNLCVAYLVKSRGGSAYTVGYAEQKGLKIINIDE